MQIGLFVSNGIGGDWEGRDPRQCWDRSLEVAKLADELGFESIWVPDHLQSTTKGSKSPTVDAIMHLTAIAGVTKQVNLATGVACISFRNPALFAKTMTTLDVASNGRAEVAVGAGWHEPEWTAYGYGFPPARERLARLREGLEIITEMLQPGKSSFKGERYEVNDIELNPLSIHQPRMPIIVGGNGQKVTWRLAARYADELNLDEPPIDDIPDLLPIIRHRCEEIDRDPASLRLSALMPLSKISGQERVEYLARLVELGFDRVHSNAAAAALDSDEPIHQLIEDCRAAGVELQV